MTDIPTSFLPLPIQLTEQFYAWERRGRGWDVWAYPVQLEPPFAPFFPVVPQAAVYDDGHHPSWWERLTGRRIRTTAGSLPTRSVSPPSLPLEEFPLPDDERSTCVLEICLPQDFSPPKGASEQFLLGLSYSTGPISFEVAGAGESITLRLACDVRDKSAVVEQLLAFYPQVSVGQAEDLVLDEQRYEDCWAVVDFGLSQEFMRPLRSFDDFSVDPLVALLGPLGNLEPGEAALIQILFQPVQAPWAESIFRAVTDWSGESFFVDAPDMMQLAKEKIRSPLYAAVVRVAAYSDDQSRAWDLLRRLGGGLAQFGSPPSNELIPLTNDGYDHADHIQDLIQRRTHRCGMLLNVDELAGFVHLPSASVQQERLKRVAKTTKVVPLTAQGKATVLGMNSHRGRTVPVTLSVEQRLQHMHVIGASGTGKSTMLESMITQDLEQGHGLALLDPHGDLVESVLTRIPDHRLEDVILLDPADEYYPVGLNVLNANSPLERNLLASDLVAVFQRLSTSWGDQMTTVLANAFLAFLESPQGGTLADLRRFLVEPQYRKAFLDTVPDEHVVYYWQKEFPLLSGRPQGPILTRLDAFLRTKCLRYMVAQKTSTLDFSRMLQTGKIFLAKLSHGIMGAENSALLGSLLIAKLYQSAFSRQSLAQAARRPFFVYLDEFHNFVTPSMLPLLTGGRKYGIGLIMAHQELHQLERGSPDVASAVLGNASTRVCFRVAESDARKLAEGFASFSPKDFLNLARGEALVRIEQASHDCNLTTIPDPSVPTGLASSRREQIVASTRAKYARRREEIEQELAAAMPKSQELVPSMEPGRPDEPSANHRASPPVEPSVTRPARPVRILDVEPPLMGKGGAEHKYLQQFIKRWAEGMGYRATIEKPLPDGSGSVDVALEKDSRSIACEITITTSIEHECGNIQKCLIAGYDFVAAISSNTAKLNEIESAVISRLSAEQLHRVKFLTPEALFEFIEGVEAQAATTEKTVRGYKVKVNFKPLDEKDKSSRKQAVSKVVVGALKRIRGKQ